MKKGQMNIGAIIGIAISILIPAIGGYFYQSRKIDDKIGTVEEKLGAVKERTAKLEEAITTLKDDTKEIKSDIKTLLKRK